MSHRLIVQSNQLIVGDKKFRCAIGKGGLSDDKREGDGATPIGIFPLRECWYRPDRLSVPQTQLPLHEIHPHDGWCDDPKSPKYNHHVALPFDLSHEKLWRDDAVYDLIIPLGYNDDPAISGKGSAIFMHIAKPHYEPTEGCIALAQEDLLSLLPMVNEASYVDIKDF